MVIACERPRNEGSESWLKYHKMIVSKEKTKSGWIAYDSVALYSSISAAGQGSTKSGAACLRAVASKKASLLLFHIGSSD